MSQIWYEDMKWVSSGVQCYTDSNHISRVALIRHAIHNGLRVVDVARHGNRAKTLAEIVEDVSRVSGCRAVLYDKANHPDSEEDGWGYHLLINEQGCLGLNFPPDKQKQVEIRFLTTDEAAAKAVEKYGKENLMPDPPDAGPVFALTQGSSGFQLTRLGVAGEPFIEANYSKEVVDDVMFIRTDLAAAKPRGRLVVLDGPPGTGKTHLIRSLLTIPGTTFIMMGADVLGHVTSPAFLPALLQARRDAKGAMVLVLEDGDHALVPRGPDNMSAISSLLNLGDGIIGTLLDIRLVVSTNAKSQEMDPAARRPGRISRHIHIGRLPKDQAQARLNQLLGKEGPVLDKNAYTLAEVYELAADMGAPTETVAPKPSSRTIGFAQYATQAPDDPGLPPSLMNEAKPAPF